MHSFKKNSSVVPDFTAKYLKLLRTSQNTTTDAGLKGTKKPINVHTAKVCSDVKTEC